MESRLTGTLAEPTPWDYAVIVAPLTGAHLGGECREVKDGKATIDHGGRLVTGELVRLVPKGTK